MLQSWHDNMVMWHAETCTRTKLHVSCWLNNRLWWMTKKHQNTKIRQNRKWSNEWSWNYRYIKERCVYAVWGFNTMLDMIYFINLVFISVYHHVCARKEEKPNFIVTPKWYIPDDLTQYNPDLLWNTFSDSYHFVSH